jgi:hypothetical protein
MSKSAVTMRETDAKMLKKRRAVDALFPIILAIASIGPGSL